MRWIALLLVIAAAAAQQCALDIVFLHYSASRAAKSTANMKNSLGPVMTQIRTHYPESRFGLATFVDKNCRQNTLTTPPDCFTVMQTLTDDMNSVSDAFSRILPSGGEDVTPLWDAILQSLFTPGVGWRTENPGMTNLAKFIIITNKVWGVTVGQKEQHCTPGAYTTYPTDLEEAKELIASHLSSDICTTYDYAEYLIAREGLIDQDTWISFVVDLPEPGNAEDEFVVGNAMRLFEYIIGGAKFNGVETPEMLAKIDYGSSEVFQETLMNLVTEFADNHGCILAPTTTGEPTTASVTTESSTAAATTTEPTTTEPTMTEPTMTEPTMTEPTMTNSASVITEVSSQSTHQVTSASGSASAATAITAEAVVVNEMGLPVGAIVGGTIGAALGAGALVGGAAWLMSGTHRRYRANSS